MSPSSSDRKELIEELVLQVAGELGVTGIQIIGWSNPGMLRRESRLVICQSGRDRILRFSRNFMKPGEQIEGKPADEALMETIRAQMGS